MGDGGLGGRTLCRRRTATLLGVTGRPAAHDIGFHDDVARTTDHHQMFYLVAPDENQTALAVDNCRLHDREPGLAPARRPFGDAIAGPSAKQPGQYRQDKYQ